MEIEILVLATLDDKTGVLLPESKWKPFRVNQQEMVSLFDSFKSIVEASAHGDIPLRVKSATLEKILQFSRHYLDFLEDHVYNVKLTDYDKTGFQPSQWEKDFCHQETEESLLDILFTVSGYLHFQRLQDVVAYHFATIINAICQEQDDDEEKVETLRRRLGIVGEMRVESETRWCFE